MIKQINGKFLNYKRVFVFCLILLQSVGVRFLEGQGIALSIIIILLSINGLKMFSNKDFNYIFGILLFLFLNKFLNPETSFYSLIYQISLIISVYIFILQYKNKGRVLLLNFEFFIALKFLVYHSLIGYIIYLIFPSLFTINVGLNKSFFYLFYVSAANFMGIQRNSGVFWEPGVLQLIANLYLFYCIKFKKSIYEILIICFLVVSTFSTTGLIILVINLVYYFYESFKSNKNLIFQMISILVFIILFIPVFNNNLANKFDKNNTSGLIRLRDFKIGVELIIEKPIIGHGLLSPDYLLSKKYVNSINRSLFTQQFNKSFGNKIAGGYTNGFMGLIASYGLIVGMYLYFIFFKNRFIGENISERILFSSIFFITMFSEPISFTSFFLMFPLSYLILSKLRLKKLLNYKNQPFRFYKEKIIYENFDNNTNLQ